jgi:methylase of polypeptide subunit release factors
MAVKKTELYSSLWAGCDELRGGMDASQYKDYVLTLLFMKYISDKYADDKNAIIIIPDGASFNDLLALKNNKEIGDKINKTIGKLAEENELKGVIDVADFNDEDKLGKGKEMVDRLSNLLGIFEGIDLSANRAEGDDLLGDAYEYLMRHFATESGKSKGQFYTPAEVSRILAKVVGITPETRQDGTVYDPTCGSGSLLLKVANEAPNGLTIYGQEMDNATVALAKMNMILHDSPTAVIWKDNTLAAPYWKNPDGSLKTFDFAVANPPFSYKSPSQFSGYSESLVDASRVKTTILNHPEFTAFAKLTLALYQGWQNYHENRLKNIAIGDKPKALIALLSEDLLKRFVKAELLDKYDIYQLLMDYWDETMQDDVYILVQDGWKAGNVLRELVAKKGEKLKEAPDLMIGKQRYKADLIPPGLIVARYFAKQQQEIDQLQTDLDVITQELEALIEEHTGEDGALVDAQTDTGKVTKNSIKKLIGDSKQLSMFEDLDLSIEQDDVLILQQCLKLFEQEETMKKKVKEAQTELDKAVFAQYRKLTEDEIKTLVIDDKWGATLEGRIIGEIERVTQQLASRIKELDERYAEPLPQLVDEVEVLSSRVEAHLKKMGLNWS